MPISTEVAAGLVEIGPGRRGKWCRHERQRKHREGSLAVSDQKFKRCRWSGQAVAEMLACGAVCATGGMPIYGRDGEWLGVRRDPVL